MKTILNLAAIHLGILLCSNITTHGAEPAAPSTPPSTGQPSGPAGQSAHATPASISTDLSKKRKVEPVNEARDNKLAAHEKLKESFQSMNADAAKAQVGYEQATTPEQQDIAIANQELSINKGLRNIAEHAAVYMQSCEEMLKQYGPEIVKRTAEYKAIYAKAAESKGLAVKAHADASKKAEELKSSADKLLTTVDVAKVPPEQQEIIKEQLQRQILELDGMKDKANAFAAGADKQLQAAATLEARTSAFGLQEEKQKTEIVRVRGLVDKVNGIAKEKLDQAGMQASIRAADRLLAQMDGNTDMLDFSLPDPDALIVKPAVTDKTPAASASGPTLQELLEKLSAGEPKPTAPEITASVPASATP